jgi:hypothetical protein
MERLGLDTLPGHWKFMKNAATSFMLAVAHRSSDVARTLGEVAEGVAS